MRLRFEPFVYSNGRFSVLFLGLIIVGMCEIVGCRDYGNDCPAVSEKLKRIADALVAYRSAKGKFPPVRFLDAHGVPMHSWRTRIVPYLESSCFTDEYDLGAHWNKAGNIRLLTDFVQSNEDGSSRNCVAVSRYFCFCKSSSPQKYETAITMLVTNTDGSTSKAGEFTDSVVTSRESVFLIAWKKGSMHWMEPRDYTLEEIRSATKGCELDNIEAILVFSADSNNYRILRTNDAVKYGRENWVNTRSAADVP